MILKNRTENRSAGERGIALVSALMILFLITALGVIAKVTSETDIRVVGNMNESKKMFFLAEQTVDRILSHLHYNPEGLYKMLNINLTSSDYDAGNAENPVGLSSQVRFDDQDRVTLPPYKVLKIAPANLQYLGGGGDINPLVIDEAGDVEFNADVDYSIEAVIDPKNWEPIYHLAECPPGALYCGCSSEVQKCGYAKPLSEPFAIRIKITNPRGFTKVFEAEIGVKSAWDFAYYVQEFQPFVKVGESIVDLRSERCTNRYERQLPHYNCQTAFHNRGPAYIACDDLQTGEHCDPEELKYSGRMIGDVIVGDVFIGGTESRLFVRGRPLFQGELWWRSKLTYDLNQADAFLHQTEAGQDVDYDHHPRIPGGIKHYAKNIEFFESHFENSFWNGGWDDQIDLLEKAKENSDMGFSYPGDGFAYRVLFINNINTNNAGDIEESRVASAITPSINNGQVEDPADVGYMIVWRLAYRPDSWFHSRANEQAAMYGDCLGCRINFMRETLGTDNYKFINHQTDTCNDATLENCDLGEVSSRNTNVSFWRKLPGHDQVSPIPGTNPGEDPTVWVIPSRGRSCGARKCAGILYFDGDVIVSGVLDGAVSIFSKGDIILDHEIEYEKNPLKYPADVGPDSDMDMLGLFANGNIIIPQSYPELYLQGTNERKVFADDWSDAFNGEGIFQPRGNLDHAYNFDNDRLELKPLTDDDGSEDIHAVIVAAGNMCKRTSTEMTCTPTSDAEIQKMKIGSIKNFQTGFYARPREQLLYGESGVELDAYDYPRFSVPYTKLWNDAEGSGGQYRYFWPMGNQSGTLRVVGSIIQMYAGRLAYDFTYTEENVSCPNAVSIDGTNYYINSCCDKGYTELYYNDHPDVYSPETHPAWNKSCSMMGFESVEITYDPRLKLTHPPIPYDFMGQGNVQGGLWLPFGKAAYEIINWREISSKTNLAEDSF